MIHAVHNKGPSIYKYSCINNTIQYITITTNKLEKGGFITSEGDQNHIVQ